MTDMNFDGATSYSNQIKWVFTICQCFFQGISEPRDHLKKKQDGQTTAGKAATSSTIGTVLPIIVQNGRMLIMEYLTQVHRDYRQTIAFLQQLCDRGRYCTRQPNTSMPLSAEERAV